MKIKKFTKSIYGLIVFLIFHSCSLINPPEQIPSYISIDKINFKTNVSFDTESSDITDAWVAIDGQAVGAYEMPAKFPVLYTGKHTITITPGIILNGISSTRATYPFYVSYDTTVYLTAGQVVKLNPRTTYYKNLNWVWTEYFNNPNISLDKNIDSDTNITVTPNVTTSANYFEYGGKFLGIINITPAKPYFDIISDTSYVLPYGNTPSFLELNYKSTNSFSVTVDILTPGGIDIEEYVTFNPANVWKKVYVDLTPLTNLYSNNATNYKIRFNHTLDNPNVSVATVLLDNIKLITGS